MKQYAGRWLGFLVGLCFSLASLSCTKAVSNETPDLAAAVCTFDSVASTFDGCTFGP